MRVRESLPLQGKVEIYTSRGRPSLINGPVIHQANGFPTVYKSSELDFSQCELLDTQVIKNIILNNGKDRVIESLTTGFINVIARMVIGDRGTLPNNQTSPKVPTADQSNVFNEVYRADIDSTILNIGTPDNHEVTFVKTFSALNIPVTSFSNQANPIVNEVGLVLADLIGGTPLPRSPVASPDDPPSDESIFAVRTFKSVPFEAANEISITIRYTIFIE